MTQSHTLGSLWFIQPSGPLADVLWWMVGTQQQCWPVSSDSARASPVATYATCFSKTNKTRPIIEQVEFMGQDISTCSICRWPLTWNWANLTETCFDHKLRRQCLKTHCSVNHAIRDRIQLLKHYSIHVYRYHFLRRVYRKTLRYHHEIQNTVHTSIPLERR